MEWQLLPGHVTLAAPRGDKIYQFSTETSTLSLVNQPELNLNKQRVVTLKLGTDNFSLFHFLSRKFTDFFQDDLHRLREAKD